MTDRIAEWSKELQSIAQAGLFYGKDAYDRERYQRIRNIAVQDRARHNKPEYACGVVKIFYECEALGGAFEENLETQESRHFARDEIGDLPFAEEKCTKEQVLMCFDAHGDQNWKVQSD